MRAVVQKEWTDTGWSPIAVYLYTEKQVIGRAREGRPDVAAWVDSVLAGATWHPGYDMTKLADQMIDRFTHEEYGTLYDEVEPAPTLDVLAAREFLGQTVLPLAAEQPNVATATPDTLAGWKTRKR